MQETVRTSASQRIVNKMLLMCVLIGGALGNAALAAGATDQCFSHIDYGPAFDTSSKRVLYILVDQTTPLSTKMRSRVSSIVSNWGQSGDRVKIVKFSANYRDNYPELVFDGHVSPSPDQTYLYNLRTRDREILLQCLNDRMQGFETEFQTQLQSVLNGINPSIPKTDLLFSLKQVASQMIRPDSHQQKTVLIVSDGLENSSVVSFYRKGTIHKFDRRKAFAKIRRAGLVPNWGNARVYFYGLGLPPKTKKYIDMDAVSNLRLFWERYFVEGNAAVAGMGSPDLLVSSID